MRTLLTILFAVLVMGAAPAPIRPPPDTVSLVALIANPETFHGKRISVIGFLNLEFEGNGLYVGREAFEAAIHDAVWISLPQDRWREERKRLPTPCYAVVVGTFRADEQGHLDLYRGTIEQVESVDRWPARKEFSLMWFDRTPAWGLVITYLVGLVASAGLAFGIARAVQRRR